VIGDGTPCFGKRGFIIGGLCCSTIGCKCCVGEDKRIDSPVGKQWKLVLAHLHTKCQVLVETKNVTCKTLFVFFILTVVIVITQVFDSLEVLKVETIIDP
jgi:hypothetical protein